MRKKTSEYFGTLDYKAIKKPVTSGTARAENLVDKLRDFAKNEPVDLVDFTLANNITVKRLKALALENEELQDALNAARESISRTLRGNWRGNPSFKDYALANIEYNDDDYKAFRNEIRAQVTAKTTGGSAGTLLITSDSLGMVANKENP